MRYKFAAVRLLLLLMASAPNISTPPDDAMYRIYGVANSILPTRRVESDTVLVGGALLRGSFVRNTAPICDVIWNFDPSRPFPGLRGAPR